MMTGLRAIIACAGLAVALHSCGDDEPLKVTNPLSPQENALLGTWVTEDGNENTMYANGNLSRKFGPFTFTGTWRLEGDTLIWELPAGTYVASIDGTTLSFSTKTPGASDLGNHTFTTDSREPSLIGTTWTDEDGRDLVFDPGGNYSWGAGFEEGFWALEGEDLTVKFGLSGRHEVTGDTLTIVDDGETMVMTRKR